MITRTIALVFALGTLVMPAWAQTDRVVALVVSVGEGSARADAIQAQLQVMGAETLRSADPSNAELRSMLKRFATEAVNTRASLVYLDLPAIVYEGRSFVLPADVALSRPTDLFTRAIPLSAFARAAAQAEQGGGVILAVGSMPAGLPDGLSAVGAAPDPVAGASPVLVAKYGASDPIVQVISAVGRDEVIELGAIFRRMTSGAGVSISALPRSPTYLRSPPAQEEPATPVIEQAAGASDQTSDKPESLEELSILEQSLSRSAKRTLQRSLRDLGYYKGLVDGIFGPQTREAITAFQTSRGEDATAVLTRRQLLDLR